MIDRVSQVNGRSGKKRVGRLEGSSPSSPTLGICTWNTTAAAVSATMATRGAGMMAVSFGRNTMMSSPTATKG